MGPDDLYVHMREEYEWARDGVGRIMGDPWSHAVPWIGDDGSPAAAPTAAPSAAPLPDGSGRRRNAAAVRAAGDEIEDDEEAAKLLGAVRAYLRLLYLYKFVRCWDTASDSAAAALRGMVETGILPLYGEGKHPAKTAIANALPDMFYALSVKGMPFDSNEIERAFHELLGPYKRSHFQTQSVWGMTTGEELLTFIGMCTRNGIDPADGLDMLMADPNWFAADDGAACAPRRAASGGAVRQVRRYSQPARARLHDGGGRRAASQPLPPLLLRLQRRRLARPNRPHDSNTRARDPSRAEGRRARDGGMPPAHRRSGRPRRRHAARGRPL